MIFRVIFLHIIFQIFCVAILEVVKNLITWFNPVQRNMGCSIKFPEKWWSITSQRLCLISRKFKCAWNSKLLRWFMELISLCIHLWFKIWFESFITWANTSAHILLYTTIIPLFGKIIQRVKFLFFNREWFMSFSSADCIFNRISGLTGS